MRRSTVVTLTILAAASGAAIYAFSGDDVDTTDYVVTDEASCVQHYGTDAQADCTTALAQARQQHVATAPRFANVEACREATGSECETTPATLASDKPLLGTAAAVGAGIAIPILAGVMIGRMMDSGAGRVTTPLYAGRPPGECAPGAPQAPGCSPRSSSSSSSGSGGRFYYSGTSYAGTTGGAVARGGAAAFTASPDMARTISTGSGSVMGRSSTASVSRGGFGASARGFSSSS
jgi:uncharacterized protein YgiB involved in biofilm formation